VRERRIGIDLGTTNTVAAFGGQVLPVGEGRSTLPSVVAFLPNGKTAVGEPARRRRAIDGVNTLFSCKRIIGRRFDAYEAQCFRDRYPTQLEEGPDGGPVFRTRAGAITPVEVGSLVLRTLIERTGMDLDGTQVTVTVPANFNPHQRAATAQAAAQAGLGEVALLEEPLATAHAYAACGTRAERAFVYDLGGGTFDCAVVDCTEGSPRLIAHTSDLMLGGDDLDQRLAGLVRHQVLEKHNWDLASYSEIFDRLLAECEKAKITLSMEEQAEFLLGQVDPECPAADEPIVITTRLLEVQTRELLQRSFSACDQVLRDARMKASDIDAVFLAGGPTMLPVVHNGVEAYFGRPGAMGMDPTEVVALGASLAAV
jgi:molecular chaperone DnaK (HSP70)